MTIITISRQYGSGGDEVASRICQLLGYKEFDKSLIAQAAKEVGLANQEVIDFSEENHKIRGFLDRLFGRQPTVGTTRVWTEASEGARVMEEYNFTEESAVALVERAVLSAYTAGRLVIVGRGGQAILKDHEDVLHIRIEAPMEDRIQRAKHETQQHMGEFYVRVDARREAQDLIDQKDAASSDYIQRFYHVDWSSPLLYHMVINTGKLSIDQAARIIVQAVKQMESEQRHSEPVSPAA